MTQVSRKYAWLVLAGYFSLALAVTALTPVPVVGDALPPIAPLVLADQSDDDAMMLPLRRQATEALRALQTSNAQRTANAF